MNHSLCINRLLTKYKDFPSIQIDIRKAIGYAESQSRMFLKPFVEGTEEALDPTTPELDQLA